MTQEHYNAFIRDVTRINRNIRLTAPRGCGSCFKSLSSLSSLADHLYHTKLHPRSMSVDKAKQYCDNPNDPRLAKYNPALQRLTSVWGRGVHRPYPHQPGFTFVSRQLRVQAYQNFRVNVATLPVALRPRYREIVNHDQSAFDFNNSLGPAYLHRFAGPNGNIDITARGLLLKAGLGVPGHIRQDRGYIDALRLTQDDLNSMYYSTILDAGCGAAIFCSEMAVHYNATTTGLDLNPLQIANAIGNGTERYVKSILYLKMLKDMNALQRLDLPANSAPLIDRLFTRMNEVVAHYNNVNNLPLRGDIFNINPLQLGNARGTWDFTVCLNVLGYFTPDEQTEIMLNLCAVTRRKVFVYSGSGALRRLEYDRSTITNAFPGCTIRVINEKVHHISI